jgi:hypothetical protein
MAAYSRRKRGSVVDRTVSPKGAVLTPPFRMPLLIFMNI